jgi:hypothetical protein
MTIPYLSLLAQRKFDSYTYIPPGCEEEYKEEIAKEIAKLDDHKAKGESYIDGLANMSNLDFFSSYFAFHLDEFISVLVFDEPEDYFTNGEDGIPCDPLLNVIYKIDVNNFSYDNFEKWKKLNNAMVEIFIDLFKLIKYTDEFDVESAMIISDSRPWGLVSGLFEQYIHKMPKEKVNPDFLITYFETEKKESITYKLELPLELLSKHYIDYITYVMHIFINSGVHEYLGPDLIKNSKQILLQIGGRNISEKDLEGYPHAKEMLEFNQKFLNSGNFDFMYSSK